MGIAIFDIDIPIIKTSSSILLLSDQEMYSGEESPCIRCGKCVDACPMNLLPLDLDRFARNNANEAFETYKGMNCIECGSCSLYVLQSVILCNPFERHDAQSWLSVESRRRIIMSELTIVSSSPHVRSNDTTSHIMRDVIIALIPATLVGFYVFGVAAVLQCSSQLYQRYFLNIYIKSLCMNLFASMTVQRQLQDCY